MKYCILIAITVAVFLMLPFRYWDTAFASEAPVSGSSEAALPANTKNSEKTDVAHITISADRATATTSLRSAPIQISAVLNREDGPVPDGTTVDFAISSGTGILSGATTTVNGIATVKLTSTTVGTVIVTASAGSVSATISTAFLTQPQLAIVKVATVGELASGTSIGGILASVNYPLSGYSIASGGISPSGVTNESTTSLASNVETSGQVILALFDVNGIQIGEFATMTFQVTDGFLPNISDFTVSSTSSVISAVRNSTMPGISVVVQGLTLR